MKSLKKFYLNNKRSIFKSFVCCIVSCSVFLCCSVSAFAKTVDDSPDMRVMTSSGTVFDFYIGYWRNTLSGELYRPTEMYPLQQGDNQNGIGMRLEGYYNNNTRMSGIKVERPRSSAKSGRFRVTISANGHNEYDLAYALPKLCTTFSNDTSFAVGYYDESNPKYQYIDFIGELPYEFWIITWYDYSYDSGYLRNLYYNIDWQPTFGFDITDRDSIDTYFESKVEIINTMQGYLNSSTNTLIQSADTEILHNDLSVASGIFNTFFVSLPDKYVKIIYISFACVSIVTILGVFEVVRSWRKGKS